MPNVGRSKSAHIVTEQVPATLLAQHARDRCQETAYEHEPHLWCWSNCDFTARGWQHRTLVERTGNQVLSGGQHLLLERSDPWRLRFQPAGPKSSTGTQVPTSSLEQGLLSDLFGGETPEEDSDEIGGRQGRRGSELERFRKMGVDEDIERREVRGVPAGKVVKAKWVRTNKGWDVQIISRRCHFIAHELGDCEWLGELFAGTPSPWEWCSWMSSALSSKGSGEESVQLGTGTDAKQRRSGGDG